MNKKQRLIKGLKILGAALLLLVVTTYVLTFALSTKASYPFISYYHWELLVLLQRSTPYLKALGR